MFSGDSCNIILTKKGLIGFGGYDKDNCVNKPTTLPYFDKHEVITISCGSAHSIVLTNEGLFSWRLFSNEGDLTDEIKKITFFDHLEVISISCATLHSIVLTNEGTFSWGFNLFGQLGLGHENSYTSIVLTKEGLFSFGCNNKGQLGLGYESSSENTPKKISLFDQHKVITISCGREHIIALTNEGLFSWGSNSLGQLGLGHKKNENTPKKISFFDQHEVISISCGGSHSVVFTNKGIFSFGDNLYGRLGIGHTKDQNTPKKITFFDQHEVLSISCGEYHSIVLTKEGLFSFGWNSYGQLGLGHNKDENAPKKISIDPNEIIAIEIRPLMWKFQRIIWIAYLQ